jgi:predicted NAD/FAD-binding protein
MAKIAVVGSGISGISSAYYLSKKHTVDIFESSERIGGHTHTVSVSDSNGMVVPVDTGFIVFNEKNYPGFIGFLEELDVLYTDSDMSFSVKNDDNRFFFGSDFPKGIFSKKSYLIKPSFYALLLGIHHFNNQCVVDSKKGIADNVTLADYIVVNKISRNVVENYILPMTSAIWSVSFEQSLGFPMRSFIQFWMNHQLLEIGGGLKWKTIQGGSKNYIDKALPFISGKIFTGTEIQKIEKNNSAVRLLGEKVNARYDAVVVATHADEAKKLISAETNLAATLLSKWNYSTNQAYLHTDSRFMPPRKSAWCSWNLSKPPKGSFEKSVCVTYWMNRLQPLNTTDNFFLTLNPSVEVLPEKIKKKIQYTHPIMTKSAMDTQPMLKTINDNKRVVFCGSYFGHGFHEDAFQSGINAVQCLEKTLSDGALK